MELETAKKIYHLAMESRKEYALSEYLRWAAKCEDKAKAHYNESVSTMLKITEILQEECNCTKKEFWEAIDDE